MIKSTKPQPATGTVPTPRKRQPLNLYLDTNTVGDTREMLLKSSHPVSLSLHIEALLTRAISAAKKRTAKLA
jgi:hypothetical protein